MYFFTSALSRHLYEKYYPSSHLSNKATPPSILVFSSPVTVTWVDNCISEMRVIDILGFKIDTMIISLK